jgi:hypothetical protein
LDVEHQENHTAADSQESVRAKPARSILAQAHAKSNVSDLTHNVSLKRAEFFHIQFHCCSLEPDLEYGNCAFINQSQEKQVMRAAIRVVLPVA